MIYEKINQSIIFLVDRFQFVHQPPLMEGYFRLDLCCKSPEKDQMELDLLIRLYGLLKVVFLFFLSPGDFSLLVCLVLSLSAHHSGLYLFREVNALDCALYLGSAAQTTLAGLTDLIGSDCRLPLSLRSFIILPTNVLHVFLEALCLCSFGLLQTQAC